MARRARVGDPVELSLGPFAGVFDSPDPGEARATRLFDALNGMIPDMTNGSAVLARHGFVGLTQQLGDSTNRTGQGMLEHHRLDGTVERYVFAGGRMYRWDGDQTFTEITPTGVVIDAANPVFPVPYNDQVIVSDETNKVWVYTPSDGTGTTVDIDSVGTDWCTKGGPNIYAGKNFVILRRRGASTLTTEAGVELTTEDDVSLTSELLSGAQNTILWAEELTPLIGYQQTDFDNAWTLTQTSGEVLGALSAEEGALMYLRQKGIGTITGAVNTNFVASATRDNLSSTRGTDAPSALVSINRKIWFLDMDGRVCRAFVSGGEPEQLYFPIRREIEEHIGTAANRANVVRYGRAAYHEGYGLVLFTIWDRKTLYAFDAETGVFVGEWLIGGSDADSAISIDAMGSMIDANNRSTFVILGTRDNTYTNESQGVFWREKHPDDAGQWLDQADASSPTMLPLARAIESHWLTSNAAASYRAIDVEAQLVGDTARHAVALQYIVPGSGASRTITAQSTATVGEKSAADSIASARWSLGPNAQGTAMRVRISATHADNVRWGVHNLTVHAIITKARPGAT